MHAMQSIQEIDTHSFLPWETLSVKQIIGLGVFIG